MKQDAFIARHADEWAAFARWLERRGRRWYRQDGWDGLADAEVPAQYRRLCQQAALAQRRGYSPQLVAYLQVLVQRGHDVLYRAAPVRWQRAGRFLLADFPRLVRAQRGCLWLAAAAFSLTMSGMFWLVWVRPELAHAVFSPQQLAALETLYAPDMAGIGERGSQGNVQMFGFYLFNNISIGLRTFASGFMAGVGTLAVLVSNGVFFGTLAAHVDASGYGAQLWPFVAGHAVLELAAIVIAGAAGLRLGLALVAPGSLRRVDALRQAGSVGARLCAGVVVMLVLAAFVEAFWSARGGIAPWLKFSVGAVLGLLVLAWLGCGGRGLESENADGR